MRRPGLSDYLGVRASPQSWRSLGGMQALFLAIRYPERIRNALVIARGTQSVRAETSPSRGRPRAILTRSRMSTKALLRIRRQTVRGLRVARIGAHHLHLRTSRWAEIRAPAEGWDPVLVPSEFESNRTCAISREVLRIFRCHTSALTKALDYFDPALATGGDSPCARARNVPLPVISFTTDWRFSPARARRSSKRWSTTAATSRTRDPRAARPRCIPARHAAFHAVVRTYLARTADELARVPIFRLSRAGSRRPRACSTSAAATAACLPTCANRAG